MEKLFLHSHKPHRNKFERKYKYGSPFGNNDVKSKIFNFLCSEVVEPETRVKKESCETVGIKVKNKNIKVRAEETNHSAITNCAKKDFKEKRKNCSTIRDTYSTLIEQENVSDSESERITVCNDVESNELKYKSKGKKRKDRHNDDQLEDKYDLSDAVLSFGSDFSSKESVERKTKKRRKKSKTVSIEMEPEIDSCEESFKVIKEKNIQVETDDTIRSATTSSTKKKSKTKYKNCSSLDSVDNVLLQTENGTESDEKNIAINSNDIKSKNVTCMVKRKKRKLQEYTQDFKPRNLALIETNNLKKKRKHKSHLSIGNTRKELETSDSMNVSCFKEDDITECEIKSKKVKKNVTSLKLKENQNEMSEGDNDIASDSKALNESEKSHERKYSKVVDVPSWMLRNSDSEADNQEEYNKSDYEVKSKKAKKNVKSLEREEKKNKISKRNSNVALDSGILNGSEKSYKRKHSKVVDVPPWILRNSNSESDNEEVVSSAVDPTECTESLKEQLFKTHSSGVDDIEALLKMKKESEKLPIETITQLRQLRIQLRHEVPPQHFVETHAGSHIPTQDQKRRFEEYIPIKRGSFSPEEDNIIVKNWKAFCKLHNWDRNNAKPFLYMKHNGKFYMTQFKERQKFVQFLADKLPWRTLYSVYHRFRNLFEPHLGRRYTSIEDECILTHIDYNPNVDQKRKFSDLAKILNRTRASVWRRYRLLKLKEQSRDD